MSEAMTDARRVSLSVSIGGHDATGYINPCLLDFTFTDNAGGKADEVQLSLHDRDGKWQGDWQPKKGAAVQATITVRDWDSVGQQATLPCGIFKIDEIEFSGPPDKVTIKAVSAALTSGLREESKTKAWENYNMQGIASEVAEKHGLTLMYDGPAHALARQDQREESDLAFVQRLAEERGMYCKVHDGKMVLFDGDGADAKKAGITIPRRGQGSPSSFSFKLSSSGTGYDKAEVSYADPQSGTTRTATVQQEAIVGPQDEKTMQLNQRVESAAEAARLGKGALRSANKQENEATLELMGNPALVAGRTVNLTGFGQFSGAWFIEKAEHKVSGNGGYSTSLTIRKTLGAATELTAAEVKTTERT